METYFKDAYENFDFKVLILPMRNGNHQVIHQAFHLLSPVLILPMRNGNLVMFYNIKYKYSIVLILPMRNGNSSNSLTNSFTSLVLILPMRNGNTNSSCNIVRIVNSSYPTYEEWKRQTQSYYIFVFCCSYPTYEEWKPPRKF